MKIPDVDEVGKYGIEFRAIKKRVQGIQRRNDGVRKCYRENKFRER